MSRVAAIDCGTNSIRLLIADITDGNFKEVVRQMEIVRLGQGVDQNKSFHPDAIARTLSAVEKFSAQISSKGVEKARFCATSATRDATNRKLFTDGVKKILNVEVEVIPGEEEAELSFIGATKELSQNEGPFLVVDIGGGSTEFVYGGEKVSAAKSVNIGCVRMSERHLNTQPPSMAQIAQAIVDIDIAIAEGLAKRIVDKEVPSILEGTTIFSLDMGTLLAGTKYRGDFEQRLKSVMKQLNEHKDAILFIDEIHTLIGAGSASGGTLDASNLLKPALSNGTIKCIGATTYQEYRMVFEKDHALARRFQKIDVNEPSILDTINILKGLKTRFEKHHNVKYSVAAIHSAAELSAKYINDRHLPDKAIDVIDEAGAAQKYFQKINRRK